MANKGGSNRIFAGGIQDICHQATGNHQQGYYILFRLIINTSSKENKIMLNKTLHKFT